MDTECRILENGTLKNDYRKIVFHAPEIAAAAQPGQFVHVMIPDCGERILRRPFSICGYNASAGTLAVVYKIVGEGTKALARAVPGTLCRIMGPQGKGFPMPERGETPVVIAGGYGAAATLPLARRSENHGILLLGARSKTDVILADDYRAAGFEVRIATQDGSLGTRGLVTELVPDALKACSGTPVLYACGPNGMLLAVAGLAEKLSLKAFVSLDQHMCCGIGACFACVVKVKDSSSPDGWRYSRSCKEGPVYPAQEVYRG